MQVVDPPNKGIFAHTGITSDGEVPMSAMAVIYTTSFPACRFLVVLVRMAVISFSILGLSWWLSWSCTLFSSTHDGVASFITVHPPIFLIAHGWHCRNPEVGVCQDSGGAAPCGNNFHFTSSASSGFQAVCDRATVKSGTLPVLSEG